MRNKVQLLVDTLHEVTAFQSNPRMWQEHPMMTDILAFPKAELTAVLLEMLWNDPNWILLSALRMLHKDDGAKWPVDDNGRFHPICAHWITWGVHQGYLGPVDSAPDEATDEAGI
jgi:hypothetical protein